MKESIRLSQLMDQIKRVMSLNFPSTFWIEAEIAQARDSRGHIYLQLVEKSGDNHELLAQADAVLWLFRRKLLEKQLGQDISSLLKEGNQVMLSVKLDHHAIYGLKLIVEHLDLHYSLGQMALKRRQIIESLQQSGYFDLNKRLALPSVIQRIAIISSTQAAGWQDFREQMATNPWEYQFQLTLFPAAMQGEAVEDEVCAQLEAIKNAANKYDITIIIRGGGSRLDLAWFDNQRIGEQIALHPIPVITGIGHDIDETVSDLVAWKSLKTPTAVATWIIDYNLQFESNLLDKAVQIQQVVKQILMLKDRQLQSLVQRLYSSGQRILDKSQWQLNQLHGDVIRTGRLALERAIEKINHADNLVRQLDPIVILKRGYSITYYNDKVITKASSVPPGAQLKTILSEGVLISKSESNEEVKSKL